MWWMRSTFLLILGSLSIVAACAQPSGEGIEEIQNRGHDFWLVTVAQQNLSGFEAIGHFRHCYFASRDFGQCDEIFPSPSGKYAIYQNGPTGLVMLFDAAAGTSEKITDSSVGLVRSAAWSESKLMVTLTFSDSNGGSTKSMDFSILRGQCFAERMWHDRARR